jgi:phosphoribosyl 1,2-cyclic phosphodiesterase
MRFESFASGSGGNCYRVSDNHTTLLIEAGVPIRKIQEATGFKISLLDGCLISHAHG